MCNEGFFYLLSHEMYFYHPVTRDESQSQTEVAEDCCWIDHQEGRVYDEVREKVERRETGWEDMQEVFQLSCSWGDPELSFTTCPDAVLMCSMVTESMHLGCVWLSSVGVPYKMSGFCSPWLLLVHVVSSGLTCRTISCEHCLRKISN
jgi:hypothetical protein